MRCPLCQHPLTEHDAACGACGFSLDAADLAFGIPPQLRPPVSDAAGVLQSDELRRLSIACRKFEQRFPQTHVVMVLHPVPQAESAEAFAFWLFNRGGLCSALEKGGNNHTILMLVDTRQSPPPRMACMIGYGLEPFLGSESIQSSLESCRSLLAKNQITAAITACLDALALHLIRISTESLATYGLSPDEFWHAEGVSSSGSTSRRRSAGAGSPY